MKIKRRRILKYLSLMFFLINEYFLSFQLQEIYKHIYLNGIYSGLFCDF